MFFFLTKKQNNVNFYINIYIQLAIQSKKEEKNIE